MKCPIDDTQLAITDRQGVEIDYCPKCRGVWLDRGELDKLIERSDRYQKDESYNDRPHPEHNRSDDDDDDYRRPQHGDSRHDHGGDPRKHRKKESFLGDLFDF